MMFLPNLNQELNDTGDTLKFSVNSLDQAIMEAAGSVPQDKALLAYLLPCWRRAVRAASTSKWVEGPRFEAHDEAKRLCMSTCLFALMMPDLYG